MSATKLDRNLELYKRWKAGEDPYNLIGEYKIKLSRFYQLMRWSKAKLASIKSAT
jgi:hypothetical protein